MFDFKFIFESQNYMFRFRSHSFIFNLIGFVLFLTNRFCPIYILIVVDINELRKKRKVQSERCSTIIQIGRIKKLDMVTKKMLVTTRNNEKD